MIRLRWRNDRPINVSELEPLARERGWTPGAWDYYAGGAGDELTLADNRDGVEPAPAPAARPRRRLEAATSARARSARRWAIR